MKILFDIKPICGLKQVGDHCSKKPFLVDFFDVLVSFARFTVITLQSLKEEVLWKDYRNVLKPLRQPVEHTSPSPTTHNSPHV